MTPWLFLQMEMMTSINIYDLCSTVARYFAERLLAERPFCRTDISPIDIMLNGHCAERTI